MKLLNTFRSHQLVLRFPFIKQLIKYGMTGVLVTSVDFTIYFTLTRSNEWFGEHFLQANLIAFITAVTLSFFINKLWTFRNNLPDYKKQYLKFFISSFVGLIGNQSILYIMVGVAGISDLLAKPTAVAVVVTWNFLSYKFLVFTRKKHAREPLPE